MNWFGFNLLSSGKSQGKIDDFRIDLGHLFEYGTYKIQNSKWLDELCAWLRRIVRLQDTLNYSIRLTLMRLISVSI